MYYLNVVLILSCLGVKIWDKSNSYISFNYFYSPSIVSPSETHELFRLQPLVGLLLITFLESSPYYLDATLNVYSNINYRLVDYFDWHNSLLSNISTMADIGFSSLTECYDYDWRSFVFPLEFPTTNIPGPPSCLLGFEELFTTSFLLLLLY